MKRLAIAILLALNFSVVASDQVPGKPQTVPILLTGGDVYTVSGDVFRNGQVLFADGKIVAVGAQVSAPSDAKRIDVSGKRVYPGLFAAASDLGLVEVNSVSGSLDSAETGTINPNVRAEVAVNPDSEHVPVARSNGVLLNLTVPTGGLLTGSSAVIQLDGWTWEEMTVKAPAAFHLTWPSAGGRGRRGAAPPAGEAAPAVDQSLVTLDRVFTDARTYMNAKKASAGSGSGNRFQRDARWDAMIPLLEGKVPLVVRAEELRQIQAAVAFAAREKLKLVILGGTDAPLCAELLKKHEVPVIVNGVQRLPSRADAPYDDPFTLPERLRKAGVTFCIAPFGRHGASDLRNLPYHAGMASAYGLPAEEALKAITLYPAKVLGVADRVGSLENGKDATLFVADGDVLETPTQVEMAFVQGRQVDLSNKHTMLWKKYQEKYKQQGNGKSIAGN